MKKKNPKILITLNAVNYNRGSEALVCGLVDIFRTVYPEARISLYSGNKGQKQVRIKELDKIDYRLNRGPTGSPAFLVEAFSEVIFKHQFARCYKNLLMGARENDVVFILAGDNYDIQYNIQKKMAEINGYLLNTHSAVIRLIDFSISKNDINAAVIKDLKRFDILTVRDCISEQVLKENLPNTQIHYIPDPAFYMKTEEVDPYKNTDLSNTIGINVSDLILKLKDKRMILENYVHLIRYILSETTDHVLLIPHVMNGHDLSALRLLKAEFMEDERVQLVENETLSARQLKYIIGKLKCLVTARTHASIAAYSQEVPALVVGYSVKAIGIARDLFGTDKHYVVDSNRINDENELTEEFRWIRNHSNEIKQALNSKMNEYQELLLKYADLVEE